MSNGLGPTWTGLEMVGMVLVAMRRRLPPSNAAEKVVVTVTLTVTLVVESEDIPDTGVGKAIAQ